MATREEQALAAINAAEAMAISNVQLIRELKKIIPKPFDSLVELGVETQTQGIQAVATAERALVRKAAKKTRKKRGNDSKLSKAFREANERLRTKSGRLRKGKTQSDIARLAHRLKKRM